MSRNNTVSTAALFGLAGTILPSVGGILASVSVATLDLWLGGTPAALVWGTFAYFAMRQFVNGIYTIVEGATRR